MTVELSRISLKEFRRILPYMPDMEGWIGAEAHYIDSGPNMMVSSDLRINDFKYEGSALGNWELGGVYLPGEAKDHHLDAYIRRDGEEIAHLGGSNITQEFSLAVFCLRLNNSINCPRCYSLSLRYSIYKVQPLSLELSAESFMILSSNTEFVKHFFQFFQKRFASFLRPQIARHFTLYILSFCGFSPHKPVKLPTAQR